MFQETPYQKNLKSKKIIDSKGVMLFKDSIYKFFLKLAKTQNKYKLVKDNEFRMIDGHPIIFAFNHTRFQDTPCTCQLLSDVIDKRGYIFSGKQNLGFLDNVFFHSYGALFCDRASKDDARFAQKAMEEYLKNDRPIIFFPEATWNLSDEKLMNPMRWGIVKSAQRTGAQIIPVVLDYDSKNLECHTTFLPPRLIGESDDLIEAISNLRDEMATARFNYFSNHVYSRKDLDIKKEKEKILSLVSEYPRYNLEEEQSYVYHPYLDAEDVYAPVKKLVPNKNNAFLFNKRIK